LATIAAIDVAYKAQAGVIKAIAALKQKNIYFKYNIIGQGNPDVLQKLIDKLDLNDLVKIKGSIPHDQTFEKLKKDLHLQPSDAERLPRALIEAMSRRSAWIGSDFGEIPKLRDKSTIFKSKDVTDLIAKIKNIQEGDYT
jgi:glycosyltransferase involved in cell wall biosynthesis